MQRRRALNAAPVLLVVLVSLALATTALAQDQNVHIVQAGESLLAIALRYGTTVEAIVRANGLTNPDSIQLGQSLVIPEDGAPSAAVGPAMTAGGTYVVQQGDTLSAIAFRYGIKPWGLLHANGLQSAHLIYLGQTLVIPGAGGIIPEIDPDSSRIYIVRQGDTLTEIADLFRSTAFEFAQANGLGDPTHIRPGLVLRLPASYTGPRRIDIDLSAQHLNAYEGEELIFSFVSSSGRAPYYTRAGEFQVQSKIPNAYGSAWDIWMPHWLGIYWAGGTENGIHALPIMSNGQTLWAGYLGTPVSYGCIVLGTYEASLLYEWAEVGTPVSIHY